MGGRIFNFYKQGEYVYFNFTMQSLKLTKRISVENCEVQWYLQILIIQAQKSNAHVFGLWSELKKRERACYLSLHWDPMFPRLLHLSSCFGPLHCFAPEKINAFVSAKLKPTLTTCFKVTKRRTKITFRASFASFSLAFCWALSLLLSSLITENTTTLNELTK